MTRAWDEIAHGVTTVITPTPWRADDAIRIMAAERITVGQGVPTQWALMLASDELAEADLGTLRVVGTGAARMSAPMIADMRERFGVPVVVRYTSTESSLGTGTTLTSTDDEVATTVGPAGAGRGAGHRRRRRRARRRRVDRTGHAALAGRHAGLLGPGPGPRPHRGRADRRRRDRLGAGGRRLAHDRRLRAR